eukprot:TRINITY_DN9005_c0_g1_i1.p1 TRINITY_DN9005_c0_g1~~TRINITY_DN9005_c0_g1_i1.p1  ORF type:complete len:959 (+),score=117.77 TRINITY_DN9005_c0_g1_i1:1344-4220(+)
MAKRSRYQRRDCHRWLRYQTPAIIFQGALMPVEDLLKLPYLHDSALLYHIRQRYFQDTIYTAIGPIIVALNPFCWTIPHYQESMMGKYIAEGANALRGGSKQPSHSWSAAHQAYWLLRTTNTNQSILVSGESGAGKTEAVKIVLRYLAACSTAQAPVIMRERALATTRKVECTSVILEAFGNARTLLNDNSSRFGKFLTVHFDSQGLMQGATVTPYLLEKSRVVTHAKGERSYHSFYQLIRGASAAERTKWHLHSADPADYPCLALGGSTVINGVDDAAEFRNVHEAMEIVGISAEEQEAMHRVCAAIVHLLGITFVGETHDPAEVHQSTLPALRNAANLLGIHADQLKSALCVKTTQLFKKPRTPSQAAESRNALCKALYGGVFTSLIEKLNLVLRPDVSRRDSADDARWIGLLDIFGFEVFDTNSFEQLCINLANEELQNHYNTCVFQRDIEEYTREGIETDDVNFADNKPTVDLLVGKNGFLEILDSECIKPSGTDANFLAQVEQEYKPHPSFFKPPLLHEGFGIRHYASNVEYNVGGFREKNMDPLDETIRSCVRSSTCWFTQSLVAPAAEFEGQKVRHRLSTVGSTFQASLKALMQTITATNPHWIRCIKPHSSKQPRQFSGIEVMHQLRCAGVIETIRIRRAGYSVRIPHYDFVLRYRQLLPPGVRIASRSVLELCRNLLDAADCWRETGTDANRGPGAQIGATKVFLRDEAFNRLEGLYAQHMRKHAVSLQAAARSLLSKKRLAFKRAAKRLIYVQAACRALLQSKASMKLRTAKAQFFHHHGSTREAIMTEQVLLRTELFLRHRMVMDAEGERMHLRHQLLTGSRRGTPQSSPLHPRREQTPTRALASAFQPDTAALAVLSTQCLIESEAHSRRLIADSELSERRLLSALVSDASLSKKLVGKVSMKAAVPLRALWTISESLTRHGPQALMSAALVGVIVRIVKETATAK